MSCLDTLSRELDYEGGVLFPTSESPGRMRRADWVDKGEWLAAAKRAGAEKLFFVQDNPVVVFARCSDDPADRVERFARLWSLSRPRILFLASPGEINVYDLAQRPPRGSDKEAARQLNSLAVVEATGEVAARLQDFHRDNVESGRIFGDKRFESLDNRADKALIRDLKIVRKRLMQAGLDGERVRYAHSLIGRSIFIRYLEDRGILTEDYFLSVAGTGKGWTALLRNPPSRPGVDLTAARTCYPKVLQDKDFTYALYRRLAQDFNGDMFPGIDAEEEAISVEHLHLIQGLLYGDADEENRLFFEAYRFDIVPLELISSIYEAFYHSSAKITADDEGGSKTNENGTYYTPPVLAEFVLSRVLDEKTLKRKPRVLDPACGSGIFLVEAFRRMARHERHANKEPLSFEQLKEILRDRISGVDVNEEAARIAAFSLYLAMLHYLDPPAIRDHIKEGNRLPNLLAARNNTSPNCYHAILHADAFDVGVIESTQRWKERFGAGTADVVVGNPPWGAPPKDSPSEAMFEWCKSNERPIGDKERSQAFLWRASDFLKEGGRAGMLVSAGVFFKHSSSTQAFRRQWLGQTKLDEVFNFAHVRTHFFRGAISPFAAVFFEKGAQGDSPVHYWSAKETAEKDKVQAVLLSRQDLRILRDVDLSDKDTWKVFWMGSHSDRQFLRHTCLLDTLGGIADRGSTGRGLQVDTKTHDASRLADYQFLVKNSFSRYDLLNFTSPPLKVARFGCELAYAGPRILFGRGVQERGQDKGRLVARYCEDDFCYTNAIFGAKLAKPSQSRYKLLEGICWSSLARYFFFMTSSNWGLWHHEVHLDELLQLPVVLDESHPAAKRVMKIVDKLRAYHPQVRDRDHPSGTPKSEIQRRRRNLEHELDEAVFDLYDLADEHRDLIRDCCEVTLPFFYKPLDSIGAEDAVPKDGITQWIEQYARIFGRRWTAYLPDSQEIRADVHVGAHRNLLAVEFYPADKGDPWDLTPRNDWDYVLSELANRLQRPMGTSEIILDGLVHCVCEDAIIIVKRNQKRLWTRSAAREDAEATLCKAMVRSREGV